MGRFRITKKDYVKIVKGKKTIELLKKARLHAFNSKVLGLDGIKKKATSVKALVAIFDLSGFTNFCNQKDPDLVVPEYIDLFLDWLFKEVRNMSIDDESEYDEGYETFYEPPFFQKFLGDGVLFIWDVENENGETKCNIITALNDVCDNYQKFLDEIDSKITKAPLSLRCGIALGTVYGIGDGSDYVGPAINLASRLQKLSKLSFCFSRRGLDFNKDMAPEWANRYTVKKAKIRGYPEEELVCVIKSEFNKLPEDQKTLFTSPKRR